MKKFNWSLLYNPFTLIAGWKALSFGVIIIILTSTIGYFSNTVFYGLNVKIRPEVSLFDALAMQFIGYAVTGIIFYLSAIILAKRVRAQDIFGTLALAKSPLILIALAALFYSHPLLKIIESGLVNGKIQSVDIIHLIFFGFLSALVIVWTVALMYNAYTVSANIKGPNGIISFCIDLILAETITILLIFKLF